MAKVESIRNPLPRYSAAMPPMLMAGIVMIAIGIALVAVSIPPLLSNPAFTAYNYYEDNLDVNGQLGVMSLGALIIGLGSVLLAKGANSRKEAAKKKAR